MIPDLDGVAPVDVDALVAAAESKTHRAHTKKLPPRSFRSYDERLNKTQKLMKANDYENYPDIPSVNFKNTPKTKYVYG